MSQKIPRILFVMLLLAGPLSAQQAPYGGTARPVPGVIQAEDYDTGGEGVAYHDTDLLNPHFSPILRERRVRGFVRGQSSLGNVIFQSWR